MMNRINRGWIVVGIIWAVVLSIHYWNISEMVRIRADRERKVFLTMDEQFLRAHSEKIAESLKMREAFFHSAEALNLGLLTVENELEALASSYELARVSVKGREDRAYGGGMPVVLSCEGSLRKMVELLEALRRDHAYVPVTKVTISLETRGAPARGEIQMNYRYRIVNSETRT